MGTKTERVSDFDRNKSTEDHLVTLSSRTDTQRAQFIDLVEEFRKKEIELIRSCYLVTQLGSQLKELERGRTIVDRHLSEIEGQQKAIDQNLEALTQELDAKWKQSAALSKPIVNERRQFYVNALSVDKQLSSIESRIERVFRKASIPSSDSTQEKGQAPDHAKLEDVLSHLTESMKVVEEYNNQLSNKLQRIHSTQP